MEISGVKINKSIKPKVYKTKIKYYMILEINKKYITLKK